MIYKYILAIDPSGSFTEGKGTTGWCLLGVDAFFISKAGCLKATDYATQQEYWDAHIKLIDSMNEQYANKTMVVLEDYLLYADKAKQQINSRMETPQLLGILQHYIQSKGIKCIRQPASLVKQRWADKILLRRGIIKQKGTNYVHPCTKENLNNHIRDAVRHAVHVAQFRLKGDLK